MERLIKDEIFPDRVFSNFNICVDCIKGNLINKVRNVKVSRCTELLEVIHTDICGSFIGLAKFNTTCEHDTNPTWFLRVWVEYNRVWVIFVLTCLTRI